MIVPALLRPRSSDEYSPLPWSRADREAVARYGAVAVDSARHAAQAPAEYALDRRGTAATFRALDAVHGGGYYVVPEQAAHDLDEAEAAFRGAGPVVDVQTHLVDPDRWIGAGADALAGFLHMADPDRWAGDIDPRTIDGAAWAALVFGTSETAITLLTSTPGRADVNVLTNPQISAARDVVDRYAGTGRVLTHTIVHPNLGPSELDAMVDWHDTLRPRGWKCYTLWGPPTKASPTGGWFLDDEEIGFPFLERVRALGPRVVATHKGIGGPVPDASVAAASPRDIGPAAAAFPDITFVVYHSGYERNPNGEEGPFDPAHPERDTGVDRLVRSVVDAGIGPDGNVYAELGTTWFLMLRRPREAAHVLGKLLVALGPDRIVWGTDCAWYGSPQPLIDAFHAFAISAEMQERFGYPPLTTAVKERILGANAQELYGFTAAPRADGDWAANAAVDLRRAIAQAGLASGVHD